VHEHFPCDVFSHKPGPVNSIPYTFDEQACGYIRSELSRRKRIRARYILRLLTKRWRFMEKSADQSSLQRDEVSVSAAGVQLAAELGNVRDNRTYRRGIVVFAHGSGSSRLSPRNQFVARTLEEHGFVTFLLDLLTEDEQYVISKRFDISLLTTRLVEVIHWVRQQPLLEALPIGLFGASTGAAAALRAAAVAHASVGAVVSRGGRTDLTGPLVSQVRAPTLLIVGSEDRDVLALNQETLARLSCDKRLAIIPGATHLFEEQGALDDVAHLAAHWFRNHLKLRFEEERPAIV
jgi:putative phosphoribosyl transferase